MRVLVIEDEQDVREVIVWELQEEGFEVMALGDGMNALRDIQAFSPDVILLDQNLPGKRGVDVVYEIRAHAVFRNIPVIMVTGVTGDIEKIQALDCGADDYVTKPFSAKELAARTRAVHRRAKGNLSGDQSRLQQNNLVVDFSAHKVTLSDREVPLTLTEFNILSELLRRSGQVMSRDLLREKALGNLNVTDRTIDVHMASLRKKLDVMGRSIETVRGVGYRFSAIA